MRSKAGCAKNPLAVRIALSSEFNNWKTKENIFHFLSKAFMKDYETSICNLKPFPGRPIEGIKELDGLANVYNYARY